MLSSAETGSRSRIAVWAGAAGLMLLPVLAMRMAEGGAWDPGDFIFLAILLGGVGIAYEVAARVSDRSAYRTAASIAVVAALLSIWINLAVGLIGSEDNPANFIYSGVFVVAMLGVLIARFRPPGMARAMVATAIAQALVFVAALLAGFGFTGPITVFFVALWLLSAWLFAKAARHQGRASVARS